MNDKANSELPVWLQILNALLVLITLVLGVVTFFSIQDILLTVSAPLIINSADITVQQKYTLSTIRNFWALCGGAFLLAFLVVGLDYHLRRLGNPKTSRILWRTLVIEIIIIGFSLMI